MSIRRNSAYNLLGSAVPLVLSLITIPIYLGLIGEARYGVLAIAWLLLGYFGLFDLGLGRATAHRIAALRDGTNEERAKTFWTALTMNVAIGVIGGLLIWPIASYFFGHVFKIEEEMRPEIMGAVLWLVLAVPMATITGVLAGALQGRERFLEINFISVTGTSLFQIFPLLSAMYFGASLEVVLPAALAARMFTLLMLAERCHKYVFKGVKHNFDRGIAGVLLRFGGWVSVSSFISPMMVVFDRFVIGGVFGAKAVTHYTIPFQLAQNSTIIPNAISSALFPRFAASTPEEGRRMAENGIKVMVVVMTPLIAAGIILVGPFLSLWISPEFSKQTAIVGQIILFGFWLNSMAHIPVALLQGQGRPDLVAKSHLSEILPYILMLYLALNAFGVVGAAVVFLIRAGADYLLLAWLSGVIRCAVTEVLVPALLLVVSFALVNMVSLGGVEWFLLFVINISFVLGWAWKSAPGSMRDLVYSIFVKSRKIIN